MIDLTGPIRPWPSALQSRFADALGAALSSADCWRTPSPYGDRRLLECLSDVLAVPYQRTFVTSGVRAFAASFASSRRALVLEKPSFADVPRIFERTTTVVRGGWAELPGVARRSASPVAVWVTHPCRNPDGRSLDRRQLSALAELAVDGHEVVINQVYRWYDMGPLEIPDVCWSVTSLAKLCGGGGRLGWATIPVGSDYEPVFHVYGPAAVWQRAWGKFLTGKVVSQLVAACIEPTMEAREAFAQRAREIGGWQFTGGGMSVVLRCGRLPELETIAELRRAGLAVSPGSAFDLPPGHLRLAFSAVDADEATIAADRLVRAAQESGLVGGPDTF